MTTAQASMTAEQLEALPENRTDRWLIAGELRERPMTLRNRFHSRLTIRIGKLLDNWLDLQPQPRGQVIGGEAGVILSRDPDTSVGIDVVYFTADVLARQTGVSTMIEGIPTLVVEILSPSDTVEDVNEKIDVYIKARVPYVWIVDPYHKTITVYRPDEVPAFCTERDEISAEPQLPGFRVPVKALFE